MNGIGNCAVVLYSMTARMKNLVTPARMYFTPESLSEVPMPRSRHEEGLGDSNYGCKEAYKLATHGTNHSGSIRCMPIDPRFVLQEVSSGHRAAMKSPDATAMYVVQLPQVPCRIIVAPNVRGVVA